VVGGQTATPSLHPPPLPGPSGLQLLRMNVFAAKTRAPIWNVTMMLQP
jgi:hypothetical protein